MLISKLRDVFYSFCARSSAEKEKNLYLTIADDIINFSHPHRQISKVIFAKAERKIQ